MSEEVVATPSGDRRREYRLNRVLGAELKRGSQTVKARLYVINISCTGMKATNHFRLEEGETQHVRLFLKPKEEPIQIEASVAWQRELTLSEMFEIGFAFTRLSDADTARLEQFIAAERGKSEAPKNLDLSSIWKFGVG